MKLKRLMGIFLLACAAFGLSALTIDEEVRYWRLRNAAAERRDYAEAIRLQKRVIEEPSMYVEANAASDLVLLGLLHWCNGSPSEARTAIGRAIQLMKTGRTLGNGCEARTEQLLARLNRVPRQLSSNELAAIVSFTTELVSAQHFKNTQAVIARYDALGRMFDAQTQTWRREGEFQASVAKFYARQEYQKTTGKTFDPDRRPYGGREREQWDACKRIYDIWGN